MPKGLRDAFRRLRDTVEEIERDEEHHPFTPGEFERLYNAAERLLFAAHRNRRRRYTPAAGGAARAEAVL